MNAYALEDALGQANAWHALRPSAAANSTDVWNWRDEAFEHEIRRLRQAQRSPGFAQLEPLRQSQIQTNLGNALDTLGRFVEAVECYDRAVKACPEHGMARGNLGMCLERYGSMQPHLPHQPGFCSTTAFLARARTELARGRQ